MTQRTEYTCDWCRQTLAPEFMNRVSIDPVNMKISSWDETVQRARRALADYYRKDICNPCLEALMAHLEERR